MINEYIFKSVKMSLWEIVENFYVYPINEFI